MIQPIQTVWCYHYWQSFEFYLVVESTQKIKLWVSLGINYPVFRMLDDGGDKNDTAHAICKK